MYKLTRPCALRECARVTFSLGVNADICVYVISIWEFTEKNSLVWLD